MPRSLTCLFAEFDRFDFSPPFEQPDSFLSLVFVDQISFFFYACLTFSKPVDSKYETWLFLVPFLFYFILFFLFFLLLLWYSVFGYHSLFPMLAYEILLRTAGVGDSNWEG